MPPFCSWLWIDAADYDKVRPDDVVDLIGVEKLAPASEVTLHLKHKDGTTEDITLVHSFNEGQIGWFKVRADLSDYL
jgi:aconitate hydratase